MKAIHGLSLTEIHHSAHLGELSFTLEAFTKAPIATLKSAGQQDAIEILRRGYRPLLPAQVKLRQQLEAQWKADGTPAEPLRQVRKVQVHFLECARQPESITLAA